MSCWWGSQQSLPPLLPFSFSFYPTPCLLSPPLPSSLIILSFSSPLLLLSFNFLQVRNELNAILTAMDLSRCIVRRIQLNYCWAMGYNLVVLPLAAGALYPSLRYFNPQLDPT